jgi:hypothetical protein
MAWTKAKTVASGVGVLLVLATTTGIVLQLNIPHRLALAEGRRSIASHKAEPLDLTAVYEWQASRFDNAWTALPRGFQTFAHVPFQIDGLKCLWGAGNAESGQNFDEQVLGIPVNRRFDTLYVYHATYHTARIGTPVYELVFRYEDSDPVTNQIRYGVDVLDWYANKGKTVIGPTGPNSRLAWHGEYSAGGKKQPLRFCLTALENPKPFLEVTSIDLYSCKSISTTCIMAMTSGQSGLMK